MPSQAQRGQARTSEWQPWPTETRSHYIKLFALQERLRAHLKMAQQLALKNYQLNYPESARKTQPIRIVGRYEDYLKKYREDQWPDIRHYLQHMRQEIGRIKAVYKIGRPPKWYERIAGAEAKEVAGQIVEEIIGIETLTEQIWEKMQLIQAHLIITLQGDNQSLRASNQVIIEETAGVLEIARDIREALLFFPLDRAKVGLDKYGFEAIIDLSKPYTLDLTSIWQRSQQHEKQG